MTTIDMQANGMGNEELDAIFSEELETPEELAIAARIDMYAMIADVYRYPDALTRMYVRNGEFRSQFLRIMGGLPFVMGMNDDETELLTYPAHVDDDDVEAEYIRLFEAGPGNPPCPLVEGLYMDKESGRMTIFKDLILFYNNFGLSYAEGNGEDRPDHITYELEFLHYLGFLELRALRAGRDILPIQRAQKDFLERHTSQWTGHLADRMKELESDLRDDVNKGTVTFYRNIMELTDRFVALDLEYLTSLTES